MAKLTFVIQAPISESQAHRHLQDILKEINASSEYQLERLVILNYCRRIPPPLSAKRVGGG